MFSNTLLLLLFQTTDSIPEASTPDSDFPIVNNDLLSFWDKVYYGNEVSDWAFFLLIILGSAIVAKLFYWVSGKVVKKLTAKTKTKLDDIMVDMVEEPIVLAIIGIGVWSGYKNFISYEILKPNFHEFLLAGLGAFFTVVLTWLIARVVDALLEEYVVPLVEKTDGDLDDQIMPILRKGLRILIWTLGIIIALQNAGFNITALIAGLGVGGLALALAAQDTVKNIFGGIMIFADKPFRIKDRVKVEGFDGFVEEIGIRSTRLRTLEGRLVTIPNGKFSDNVVENVSAEPSRKVVLNIGLTYDTTPEQITLAMELLKQIGEGHEALEDNLPMSFNAFGDFSLGILFIYYIKPTGDILQTQTDINLAILQQFNANNLDMAFPTQTIITQPAN